MKNKLSVIIPCYNEFNTIEEIVSRVSQYSEIEKEIIIIDDNSIDGTKKILEDKIINSVDKVLFNEKNYGKGYCLRKGIESATGNIIIFQDADLEYDPSDYTNLLRPILENRADVVYGSRFIGSGEKRVLYFWHRIGNMILTTLSNMFSNLNLTDMEIGYKVFRTDVLKKIKLEENRFGIEPEITAKISKERLRIFEIGVKYFGRTYDEGKKITWKDGIRAIYCILRYNLFNK